MTKPIWTDSEWTFDLIDKTYEEVEKIGVGEMGLDIYRNQFEIISSEQMLDAYASIGMPIFYHHWSFGKHFTREWENYKAGRSGLAYELVINSNPCINYLMEENTMTMQALVISHASMGHNSFFKTNYLFKTWTDADAIVDYLVFAREYVAKTEAKEGREVVERFLDSCHALMDYGVNRYKHPRKLTLAKEEERQREREAHRDSRIDALYRIVPAEKVKVRTDTDQFPAEPEENLLYFCEKNAPNLKTWQRELIRIVRKVAQYFYPQGLTQVVNEGFASWTHYTIMNRLHDKGLTTDGAQIEFLKSHSGVVFQPTFDSPYYGGGLNPYKLGFSILRDVERMCQAPTPEDREWFPNLIGERPIDVIKDIVADFRNDSFIRQYLSPAVIRDLGLFRLHDEADADHYLVTAIQDERGYRELRETLATTYERETYHPKIEVVNVDRETRVLSLEHQVIHGRQLADTTQMLQHMKVLWTQDVCLYDQHGELIDSTGEE